ncbi:MAG: hypothetical protein JSW43_13390 [Gemmatimonadota bacterium]|nr:MAG: hypothetical protein JSW43_13390 [Gemmatimonadota bacterium]
MPERITLETFVQKMEALHTGMMGGEFKHGEYDQRLARIIGELRDRKIDAERPEITAAIDDMASRGVITPAVKEHLVSRLGLA